MKYTPPRKRNLYEPGAEKPFKVSRSKIENFANCKRCFYMDRRLGVGQPPSLPFTLNSAVDRLLKSEFDGYRSKGEKHPIMVEQSVDAVPVSHPELDDWRNNFKGVQFHNEDLNMIFFGAIDDLWQTSSGEYVVVDYKSTAKKDDITVLDQPWHETFKRQMDIYQWLLRKNGYKVSDTGYILYCNGNAYVERFDSRIDFRMTLLPYEGDTSWVDDITVSLYECLNSDELPESEPFCDYCKYVGAVGKTLGTEFIL